MKEGWCVWITGLPGSGKSVVSESLLELLGSKGVQAQLLSSDTLRKVVTPKPDYSLEERDLLYAALIYITELLTHNGVNVIIDATGNLRRYREDARRQIPNFVEAYLQCPLKMCIERETKREQTYHAPERIYDRAMKGNAPNVPGVGQPYEPPLNAEITLNAAKCAPEECARRIFEGIRSRFLLTHK